MSGKCRNNEDNNNSDISLTSRRTDGGKKGVAIKIHYPSNSPLDECVTFKQHGRNKLTKSYLHVRIFNNQFLSLTLKDWPVI